MIQETDLILNKKGNIYHLDVDKENLSTTIILVGDRDRVPVISKYFDKITHKSQHREFVIHTGYIGKKHLTVMSTGMGVGCIEICLNELDAIFNIDLKERKIKEKLTSLNIIRLGTCGSIQKDIAVDSIIKSDYGLGLDNVMNFYRGDFYKKLYYNAKDKSNINNKIFEIGFNPYIAECDHNISELFAGIINGGTVTSPGFYAPQSRILRVKPDTNSLIEQLQKISYKGIKILNFEMETSALYALSKLMGHKALTLCTVVANRETKKFSKDSEKAVEKLINYFLENIING